MKYPAQQFTDPDPPRSLFDVLPLFFAGKSPLWGTDFRPYTTLMYGNGPGYKLTNGSRPDIRDVNTSKWCFFLMKSNCCCSLATNILRFFCYFLLIVPG